MTLYARTPITGWASTVNRGGRPWGAKRRFRRARPFPERRRVMPRPAWHGVVVLSALPLFTAQAQPPRRPEKE